MPIESMLRIYFLQQWFELSDPAAEAALYDSESIRRFVGAYWRAADEAACEAAGLRYRVNRRGVSSPEWLAINRERSRQRARGEHAFHVVKRLWHFTKVRYRGLAKNTARVFAMFALANLYL